MMDNPLQTVADALVARASVQSVYGEPIVVGSTTFVPVARIQYGLGGGVNDGSPGAGGGVEATPVGVLELSESGARFLPIAAGAQAALTEAAPGIWELEGGGWLLEHESRFALVSPPAPGGWLQRVTGTVDVVVGDSPLFPQARRIEAGQHWWGDLAGEGLFVLRQGVVFRGVLLGDGWLHDLDIPDGYQVHTVLKPH